MKPLVSVCIPTYNRAEKLERAVKSLIEESNHNLEIIISDNASSDNTEIFCRYLMKSDNRVKYFRHTKNQGPTKNFEFARNKSSGKYFLWLGDDDYLEKNYIHACINELERDNSLILVSGVAAYHAPGNVLTHYGRIIQPNSRLSLFRILKYLWLVSDNSIFCGVYRSSLLKDINMPNCLAGDWAWVAIILLRGRAKVLPHIFINREYGSSMSSSFEKITSSIGAPRWHSNFPLIAIAINIIHHINYQLKKEKDNPFIKNYLICLFLIIVLGTKILLLSAKVTCGKIPFVKKFLKKI